jgi:hypothetical protein
MLYYTAVDTISLELLKQLLAIPCFSNLYLAGGTSLALQIGHRKSIDLDLFGAVETEDIANALNSFGNIQLIKKTSNIQIYIINGVKVDIVNYNYPWIDVACKAGKKDIAAMKLAAITGRGSRKDFVDLYFFLKEFNLQEMLSFYSKKYHDGSSFLVLKSLTYFNDAELDPQLIMLKKVDWKKVKQTIVNAVDTYLERLKAEG